ncbi:MAG: coiled-coil domain-containing protein, partial [Mycobacterium sp.]
MRFDRSDRFTRVLKRPAIAAIAGLMLFGGILASGVQADPADDALAKLNELSRQAEQTTEAMHSAQLDLNDKLAVQEAAEAKHAADVGALDSARSQLATFQTNVNKVAAAQYMGGRPDGMNALLTASSPQGLIDQMSIQRVMAAEMSSQMKSFREASATATIAEQASAKSAAEAKTAAEQAAAVRADLQSKQSKLQVDIAIVKSQYEALTPTQREALAAMPPAPAIPPPPAPLPPNDPAILALAPPGIAPPPAGAVPPPPGSPPGDMAPPLGGGHGP